MADPEKARANQLHHGDAILVSWDSDENLQAARSRVGSEVAELTRGPEKAERPEPGKRGGYRLVTSKGVIGFVTSVQGVLRATAADVKRQARRDADGAAARMESQGTLDGVVMSETDRAAAVKPADPALQWRPGGPNDTKHRDAVDVPDAEPPKPLASNGVVDPDSPAYAMVLNYRAQARASTTQKARDYWNRKAHEVAKSARVTS